jgi:hypothetical protein
MSPLWPRVVPSCNATESISALAGGFGAESLVSFLLQLRVISIALFRALPNWQQLCMTRREYKEVNEIQPFFREAIPYDISYVFPAEFAEVLCLDNNTQVAVLRSQPQS